MLGSTLGPADGTSDGELLGPALGRPLGRALGTVDGTTDGKELGTSLGDTEGLLGDTEGLFDGTVEGSTDGASLGSGTVTSIYPPVAKVTADWARAQPCNTEFAPNVIAVLARMDPSTTLLAPRVAAEPTTQTTFSALAPFIRMKWVSIAVTKVLVAWKINVGLGSFSPSRVTVPTAKLIEPLERYTPGVKVKPPISPKMAVESKFIKASWASTT